MAVVVDMMMRSNGNMAVKRFRVIIISSRDGLKKVTKGQAITAPQVDAVPPSAKATRQRRRAACVRTP